MFSLTSLGVDALLLVLLLGMTEGVTEETLRLDFADQFSVPVFEVLDELSDATDWIQDSGTFFSLTDRGRQFYCSLYHAIDKAARLFLEAPQ